MHFHFQLLESQIFGWLVPDNPGTVPVIEIVAPDGAVTRMRTNQVRLDVRDGGFHHTGEVGFLINDDTYEGYSSVSGELEIREPSTGLVLYRSVNPDQHLLERVFRYETQVMPYGPAEASWSENFALYYNAIERYPFDTLRWILESEKAPSVALSGRINVARWEPFFRHYDYKTITLLRDPFEELAERLLFLRFASSSEAPADLKKHLSGLEGLDVVARRINLAVPSTIGEAFSYLTDKHIHELSNPIVKSLTCGFDEHPRRQHVELALNKLSTFDLVGVRSRYDYYRDALTNLLSRDIIPEQTLSIESTSALVPLLREVKIVRSMFKFDELLYEYTQEAVDRAIKLTPLSTPLAASQFASTTNIEAS